MGDDALLTTIDLVGLLDDDRYGSIMEPVRGLRVGPSAIASEAHLGESSFDGSSCGPPCRFS